MIRLNTNPVGVGKMPQPDHGLTAIIGSMSDPSLPVSLPAVDTRARVDNAVGAPGGFNADETTHFQARMPKAPVWFCSFLASNRRETRRFRDELAHIKGAWPLLMKERRGGTWTDDDKVRLQSMVRSASSVSPYLFIWAIPGSMALLPFLAWYLDRQRKRTGLRGDTPRA